MGTIMASPTEGFGARLRELRQKAGLTQHELATRAGMNIGSYTKIEQGDREPKWSSIVKLARALNVGVGAFDEPAEEKAPGADPSEGKSPRRRRPRKDAGQ